MTELLTIEPILEKGLNALNLSAIKDPLMHYLSLLNKWNKAYNLTAIRDLKEMVSRHLLDSLAISPWLHGKHILDAGSGPGLPGIPLSLCNPDLKFTLLDSNGKKTRFLEEVIRQLKLSNVEVIQSRAENYQPAVDFDTVTSRAFSELKQMVNWTKHLTAKDGIWLAMKGRYPEEELKGINLPFSVENYTVPGLEDSERCCVIIQNQPKE